MLIFAWNYSTYCNFTGCKWVSLPERAAESWPNTFSHRHAPTWYTKMVAVTWPGDTEQRQLQWVYRICAWLCSQLFKCKRRKNLQFTILIGTHNYNLFYGRHTPISDTHTTIIISQSLHINILPLWSANVKPYNVHVIFYRNAYYTTLSTQVHACTRLPCNSVYSIHLLDLQEAFSFRVPSHHLTIQDTRLHLTGAIVRLQYSLYIYVPILPVETVMDLRSKAALVPSTSKWTGVIFWTMDIVLLYYSTSPSTHLIPHLLEK